MHGEHPTPDSALLLSIGDMRDGSLHSVHLEQETESDDAGYWTGNYYCIACGELIVHP